MQVTSVKIRKLFDGNDRLSALLSVTLDNELVIHDIKVINGDGRTFIAMPSKRDSNGIFHDIAHPITSEARHGIESQVLELYFRQLERTE